MAAGSSPPAGFITMVVAAFVTAAVAEALRIGVARIRVEVEGATLSFTVSTGLAVAKAGAEVDALLRQADKALYEAKRGGRNRVVVAGETPPARAA